MEISRKDARLCGEATAPENAAITPEAVLAAFGPDWFNADRCRDWLLRQLHPDGPACPACQSQPLSNAQLAAFYSGRRLQCSQCGRFYSATSGTLLESAKLSPAQLVMLAFCQALDMHTITTARLCGVNPNTVRFWRNRLEASE